MKVNLDNITNLSSGSGAIIKNKKCEVFYVIKHLGSYNLLNIEKSKIVFNVGVSLQDIADYFKDENSISTIDQIISKSNIFFNLIDHTNKNSVKTNDMLNHLMPNDIIITIKGKLLVVFTDNVYYIINLDSATVMTMTRSKEQCAKNLIFYIEGSPYVDVYNENNIELIRR